MLSWAQKVLPQPPEARRKTKTEEEEGAEPEREPETETALEETVLEEESLPPEEPCVGEEVAAPGPQETQEAAPSPPTSLQAQVTVVPEVNRQEHRSLGNAALGAQMDPMRPPGPRTPGPGPGCSGGLSRMWKKCCLSPRKCLRAGETSLWMLPWVQSPQDPPWEPSPSLCCRPRRAPPCLLPTPQSPRRSRLQTPCPASRPPPCHPPRTLPGWWHGSCTGWRWPCRSQCSMGRLGSRSLTPL
ncbi:uncharacterized protein [Vicugna pacos]|uniref:Uncharacterized protein isoform X2 n=1 Tax=Vicugna pacos TaxID=30538 RepID=A0ABM5DRP4_VICPA